MARKGDVLKLQLLLDQGAAMDPVDQEFQSTPLGLAARWGRRGVVAILIARGADVNKAGAARAAPLAWARAKGHTAVADQLRRAGAEDGR